MPDTDPDVAKVREEPNEGDSFDIYDDIVEELEKCHDAGRIAATVEHYWPQIKEALELVRPQTVLLRRREELIDRLAARVGEGWRPIESAPKDGTKIDAWDEMRWPDCFYSNGEWLHYEFSRGGIPRYRIVTPNLWRPLPPPPETDDGP